MDSSLRIIVTGLMAQHPLIGGITWHYLQYLMGLSNLGHDVYYFEDSGQYPYDLDGGSTGTDWLTPDCSANVGRLAKVMAQFGFEKRWAYRCAPESAWFGLPDRRRQTIIQSADLLIDVSGSLERPEKYRRVPHLIYIDTDPIFTQIKILSAMPEFAERVQAHDTHFSFGESLATSGPMAGYDWLPTRQPIVLSEWESSAPIRDVFTTVMNWTSYATLTHSGVTYGQKDVEFRQFLTLPNRVEVPLEVALSRTQYEKKQDGRENSSGESRAVERDQAGQAPQELLRRHGWRIVDAIERCGDFESYRHYITSSRAEWSVAKNGYVQGQPGWFSERSACYLAAGRPVVVQDTGFGSVLPVGEGILSFSSFQEAVAAIQELEANYERHARAARAIAEEFFDAGDVLARLIDEATSHHERSMSGHRQPASNQDEAASVEASEVTDSGLTSWEEKAHS